MPPVPLRLAQAADLATLNDIAFAAKAHWGYDLKQLQAWRTELEVCPDSLQVRPVFVCEAGGQPAGFVQIATDTLPWEICALWVHPTRMGRGIGKLLLSEARSFAATHGQQELAIDADPNAEGFYLAAGAKVVGAIKAPIKGYSGRIRPQLRLATGLT